MSTISSCQPLAQPSLIARTNHVLVLHPYECPNFGCSIHVPHTFEGTTHNPPPYGMPQLHVRRFPPENNPFPRKNRWKIIQQPLWDLRHGRRVYLPRYGVVRLLSVDEDTTKGWRVFRCVDEDGSVLTEVVAREEWCQMKEGPLQVIWSSIRSFFF